MLGNCDACQPHGLSEIDFITESNLSSNSDSDSDSDTESDVTIKFYHWHKNESGYLICQMHWIDGKKSRQT